MQEWLAYYEAFPGDFSADAMRPGCQPVTYQHDTPLKSIVLVHGLSDSPYFMQALGAHFHTLGFDVYLPVLQGHGLSTPGTAPTMRADIWKRNVAFAIDSAATLTPGHVSIGGLSTGGALSTHAMCTNPAITGSLFLFSAALGVLWAGNASLGRVAQWLLRRDAIIRWRNGREASRPLIGANPYKYDYVPAVGAHALSTLIRELDLLLPAYSNSNPVAPAVFGAHAEDDRTADVSRIRRLRDRHMNPSRFHGCFFPVGAGVAHGGIVLDKPIVSSDGNVEMEANPCFEQMVSSLDTFLSGQ